MTRHPRKQPTKLDINDSLAQLSVKNPDTADKCRVDLLESIRRTSRILCRFEKHLDTVKRADSRRHIKARLLGHASDLLGFESTVSLRISREIAKHKSTVRVPYSGPPGYCISSIMSTPMTSDQHAQLLHIMVATMEKQALLLEQFQRSTQLSEIKLEGVKLPTYGGGLDESFQLYKEQVEQYFFARGVNWKS
ncbi:unnamed protein product [Peronospora effusa]|nr:unnamed protein product [Peronospora effusa]